MTNRIR